MAFSLFFQMDKPLCLLLVSKEYPNMIRHTLQGLRHFKIKKLTRVNNKKVASEVRKKTLCWSQSYKTVTTVLCIESIPEGQWLAFI